VFDQRVQRAFEQLAELAARECMAQELACSVDFVPELGAGCELDAVALGGEGFEAARSTCSRPHDHTHLNVTAHEGR
jgi:hypothetical protein